MTTSIPKSNPVVSEATRSGAGARTIVVGYDGSVASRAALVFAAGQASSGGRVVIVHAFELPPHIDWPEYGAILAHRHALGKALLDELQLGDRAFAGPRYEVELMGGPPASALVAAARAWGADEIVVGAGDQDKAGAESTSVATELRDLADCPIVLIQGNGKRQ